jgi:hypothetical protein
LVSVQDQSDAEHRRRTRHRRHLTGRDGGLGVNLLCRHRLREQDDGES